MRSNLSCGGGVSASTAGRLVAAMFGRSVLPAATSEFVIGSPVTFRGSPLSWTARRPRGFSAPGAGGDPSFELRHRCDGELTDFVCDERSGLLGAVRYDQSLQTSVFSPDDPHFAAGHESETERGSPVGFHHREKITVRQARSRKQAGDGVAVLDSQPGRLRAGRSLGCHERCTREDGESERPCSQPPCVPRAHGQGSQLVEKGYDSGFLRKECLLAH